MKNTDNTFLNSIEEYSINRINDDSVILATNHGLSCFLKFSNTSYASLFLMNNDSFEFEHSNTIPNEHKDDATEVFAKLIENNSIGDALNSGSVYYYSKQNNFNELFFIINPMISSSGIIGLVLLAMDKEPELEDTQLIKIMRIFSGLFTSTLENVMLRNDTEKNKELLDQQVAYRTMNLAQTQKKLSDKFESLKSNLSMSIPHEVRTPINQILGFSDFLVKYFHTVEFEEAQEMLNDINESAKRLKTLFENYLFFANLSIVATNINEILSLQQKVTPSAEGVLKENILIKADECERADDITFDIDDFPLSIGEEYLKKIADEIIDNSLKYSEKGTEIIVECKKNGIDSPDKIPLCRITFTDNGRGMTEEQINDIDAYMQFDRRVYEQQGAGLGMSIVLRIVDLHNGKIELLSKKDKFTKVIIQLPIAKNVFED